jgi:hypothetical protein
MMKNELLRREGFWRNGKDYPELPKPVPNDKPWKGKRRFLKALAKAESRDRIGGPYKGWSNCRICDCKNGSSDYQLKGWEWPSGFHHYVEKHNIRPSLAFQEFILGHYVGEQS